MWHGAVFCCRWLMKFHISRVTISCPKGFVFLPFRLYWSSSPNHTLRLDCCTRWKLQRGNAKSGSVKALFWNDACAPLYQRVPLTPIELPGCLGVPRTCCSCWSSLAGAMRWWQWHWQGNVLWHSCSPSPGLQHALRSAGAHVEAKTFWATPLCYTPKGSLPALWMLSTS